MRRFRFTIRGLMILVVVAGLLTWLFRSLGRELTLALAAVIAMTIIPIGGLVWSIGKINGNPPQALALSIFVLIVSMLLILLFLICLCGGMFVF